MTTSQTILVASALDQMGFQTQILSGKMVRVSLNRKLFVEEVETALEQAFEGIDFKLRISGNGVTVE